jgi:hypothetical protein
MNGYPGLAIPRVTDGDHVGSIAAHSVLRSEERHEADPVSVVQEVRRMTEPGVDRGRVADETDA